MIRSYSGGAKPTTLASPLTEVSTIANTGSLVGWPDYTQGPFIAVIDRGGTNEEKVLCSEFTGTTVLLAARGYDGTSPRAHSAGESFEHSIGAVDAEEPNRHVNGTSGVHGLSALDQVVGAEASQVLTNKTLDGRANTFSHIPGAAIDVDSLLALPPIGAILPFAASAVPAGWLLCDGASFSGTTYPKLQTALGGTTLPDLRNRFVLGAGASALGVTGGVESVTLTAAQSGLPGHTHAAASTSAGDHGHGSAGAHAHTASHAHSIDHDHPSVTSSATDPTTLVGIETSNSRRVISSLPVGSTSPSGVIPATTAEVGTHTHTVDVPALAGSSGTTAAGTDTQGAHTHANAGAHAHPVTVTAVADAAAAAPHTNMPPFLALNWIIRAA